MTARTNCKKSTIGQLEPMEVGHWYTIDFHEILKLNFTQALNLLQQDRQMEIIKILLTEELQGTDPSVFCCKIQ
jgi:hypothetical protein